MVNATKFSVVVLCLVYLPTFALALVKRYGLSKRFGEVPRSKRQPMLPKTLFKGPKFEPLTVGVRHGSLTLECEAGGSPAPTIHWLKDGVRMTQGVHHSSKDDTAFYEDHDKFGGQHFLRLGTTSSRLYLDCLTDHDEAEYTCVAESPVKRDSQSTVVIVEKRDKMIYSEVEECTGKKSVRKGASPKVYMWSSARLEYEGAKVQLFCRAEGTPTPTITWYDPQNMPISEDDERYRVAKNGDLIIHEVTWAENFGRYTCEASNYHGSSSTNTFLYPTKRSDRPY